MKNVKQISIYNPKHPDYEPEPKVRAGIDSDPIQYGGPASFNDDGQNQRTVGRVDSKGNYIRCSPKDIGYKKNKSSKAKPTAYLVPVPVDGVDSIQFKSHERNEKYFAEYGYTEIRESYKYRNEDNEEIVNPRWGRFIKPVKGQIIYKLDPVNCNVDVVDPTI